MQVHGQILCLFKIRIFYSSWVFALHFCYKIKYCLSCSPSFLPHREKLQLKCLTSLALVQALPQPEFSLCPTLPKIVGWNQRPEEQTNTTVKFLTHPLRQLLSPPLPL